MIIICRESLIKSVAWINIAVLFECIYYYYHHRCYDMIMFILLFCHWFMHYSDYVYMFCCFLEHRPSSSRVGSLFSGRRFCCFQSIEMHTMPLAYNFLLLCSFVFLLNVFWHRYSNSYRAIGRRCSISSYRVAVSLSGEHKSSSTVSPAQHALNAYLRCPWCVGRNLSK